MRGLHTHRTRALREPPPACARKEARRHAKRRTGQQSEAQKHTRRADRELRQRKADCPRTRRAARASRVACRVRRTPARGPGASVEARSGARERRARSGEKRAAKHRTPGTQTRAANSESAPRDSPRAARVASRVACAARPLVVSAPPPARGRSEGAARAERDRQDERSTKEEKTTARERPCSTAAVMNHPRCTCAARVARAPPVTPRAPLPHSARSGDRREGARQGRRPATEAPRRTRPPQRATSVLNCGGENHPRCAAPSIDRRFEPRASALLRAGTRPTALDYGGSAGDIVRRRSERVWRVRERSRGYSAERASSPRSQSKIIDDSTHLEPRRAANCIADSIGRCRLDGGQQLVLDRVSTDRRTFCGGRRVPTEPRSSASLDASGCPHRAREQWGTVHRLNAWNECPSVDVRRWLMAFPKNNIFL